MLSNRLGKRLWIADETGGYAEVRHPADVHNRPRGRGLPDWWVVEKTPDWRPPPGVFVDGAPLPDDGAGGGASGAGAGMKIGAGHKPQPYDAHGRYTGPRGGAVSLRDGSIRMYGNDEGGEEPEDADAPQLTGILLADSGREWTDDDGGLNGGSEVRGPVARPLEDSPYPLPPPAPEEPHLTYSQSTGELTNAQKELAGRGYSGKGEAKNQPGQEGEKNIGPIPRGNYKVSEMVDDPSDPRCKRMGPHILRLEPADKATRDRLAAIGRDGFYIHGGGADASKGCIIMARNVRESIGKGALLHVRR